MTELSSRVNTPSHHDKPHLLVVDDDSRLRHLLHDYLQEQGFDVTTAHSAADARAKMALFQIDLMVLDVMMPQETGLQFLLKHRQEGGKTPVLMLTARGESADRISGLEAGADDYLSKPFEPRELVLRINAILRRQPKPTLHLEIKLGRWHFNPARDELTDGDDVQRLSSVEASLLRSLAEQAGQIVRREDLVANQPLASNERTIDVQVTRLRRKFELDPKQPRYLITVRGEGYVLRPDP